MTAPSRDARFRTLVHQASDIVVLLDRDMVVRYVSPSVERVLGFTPAEIEGAHTLDKVHVHDRERAGRLLAAEIARPRPHPPARVRVHHRDGSHRWLEALATNLLHDTEMRGIVVNARDITERVETEQALRAERDFATAVLETAGSLVVVLDPEGRIVRFNRACERLTGFSRDAVLGRPFWDVVIPEDERAELRRAFGDVRRAPGIVERENDWITTTGRRHIAWTNTTVRGPDGVVLYVVASGLDITDRRAAQIERERLHAEAETRAREVGTLLDITAALNAASSEQQMVRSVIERAGALCDAEQIGVGLLLGFRRAHVRFMHRAVDGGWRHSTYRLPRQGSITGRVLAEGQPYRSDDLAADPLSDHTTDAVHGFRTQLSVPLIGADGEAIGIISLHNHRDNKPFTAHDEALMVAVAAQAATAIERARSRQQLGVTAGKLLVSEARFRALTERSSDVVVILDRQGVIRYASPAIESVSGYTVEQCLGLGVWTNVHPDDEGRLRGYVARVAATPGPSPRIECRWWHRAGEWRSVEANANNLLGDPNVHGIVVHARDVTEQRAAEEALRLSEENFRLLFAANPRPMWVYDRETLRFMEVNQAAIAQYGYTRDEFLRMVLVDISPPEDMPRLHASLADDAAVLLGPMQSRHQRKDGDVIDVEIIRHRITFDGRVAQLEVAEDVTARLRAEAALAASERDYRLLMEQASDGIVITDAAGRFIDVNAAACEMLGYPHDDLLQLSVFDIAVPDQAADGERTARILAGQTTRGERLLCRSDGTVFPAEITLKLLPDGRLQGIFRDITEQRRAEEARERLREQEAAAAAAREADRLKTDLINTVSHELRTPLGAILGFSSMLLEYEGQLDQGEQLDFVREIESGARRLRALVDDLLEVARLQAGGPAIARESVVLANVLEREVAQARALSPGREFRLVMPPHLPIIVGDARRLGQVAGNLLANAVKFSPEGGMVTVRAWTEPRDAPDEPEEGDDGIVAGGRWATFSVTDLGIGIAPEEQARVFERFFRASTGREREIGGTGLGLAICREIVEAHDGTITLASSPGHGTTVTVRLPVL